MNNDNPGLFSVQLQAPGTAKPEPAHADPTTDPTIDDDHIVDIAGDGVDAELFGELPPYPDGRRLSCVERLLRAVALIRSLDDVRLADVDRFGETVDAGGALNVLSGGPGLEFSGSSSPTITLNSSSGTAGKILLQGNVSSTVTAGTAQILSGGSAANAGSVDLDGGTRTFTVADGSAASDLLVSAAITNGGLTKAGTGTLTLSGVNTYTGATTVSAGRLSVNGSLAASTVTVSSGATLAGNGMGELRP